MSFASEFKEFAVRGNVVDLALGVVIGAAFGKIVSTFVDNIVTPPLGLLIGGADFSKLAVVLRDGPEPVLMKYGLFLQAIFDFVIIAFALFVVVKIINKLRRQQAAAPADPPAPTTSELLLTEIRDLLRQRG